MAAAKRIRRSAPPQVAERLSRPMARTEGRLAVELLGWAEAAGSGGLIHVASNEGRAERLARIVWRLTPNVDAFVFPPWDCLPHDRSSPSARIMGLRIATLTSLARRERDRPWIVFATPEALVQRVPPARIWTGATRTIAIGDPIDTAELERFLRSVGYVPDDQVDEVGEYAIRGAVVDVHPAGHALPVRLDHADGRITAIASFDAATQRTTDAFEALRLEPVSEAVVEGEGEGDAETREPGLEHRLPALFDDLSTLIAYGPEAELVLEPEVSDRLTAFDEQIRDAIESRTRHGRDERPPSSGLYLDVAERERSLAGRALTELTSASDNEPETPRFALAARPTEALRAFVAEERGEGRRVVLAGPVEADRRTVLRRLSDAGPAEEAQSWADVTNARPGALLTAELPISEGFRIEPDVTVIASADVLGSKAGTTLGEAGAATGGAFAAQLEDTFRVDDAVIHLDHGIGRLAGIETVETGIGSAETVRLGYAGGATLMAPLGDIEVMWRYGPVRPGLKLDRLGSDAWPKRRAKVEAEITKAAHALARISSRKLAQSVPRIVPPRREYERFVARFPHSETPDQRAAVGDILRDLASERPMDRLICGDVGFGKTEVALRAAAAVVLAGRQAAIAAPTTVLVRQHLDTFRRRFADLGIEVAHLSRLVSAKEAKDTKTGLRDGRIRLVIGTHALAARDSAFADLGLLVIDEEQRFGQADKDKLKALGAGTHVLTLTATPIPRTLQSALAGLQDASVLTTPPADRLPVRTVASALDEPTFRDALLREKRRGGQSFVVCPQIEDIEPMAERLHRLLPGFELLVAHGKLKPAEIDETMVRFAAGGGDVLLATNIIESGLDVPRANTIAIWRADRFGLSQLHQLRGRVGRGRARGHAYLLTEPDVDVAPATAKRLATLASLDRLGAGFDVSAEDLDARGAGDLLGSAQAGHVKLIGAGLYRRLLERALAAARGDDAAEEWSPELNIGVSGRLPSDYVPEPEVRLSLYARIARSRDAAAERSLAEEIGDRFGPLPDPVRELMTVAEIKRLCRQAGIARVDAGPDAIALTFKDGRPAADAVATLGSRVGCAPAWKGERLILQRSTGEDELVPLVRTALEALASA